MAAACDSMTFMKPSDYIQPAAVLALTRSHHKINDFNITINDAVDSLKMAHQIQPAQLQSALDTLCRLSGGNAGAKRCIDAGVVTVVLSLLSDPNNKDAILNSNLKYQHSLLLLILRLLLAGGDAKNTPSPALVVASLSKRLLRLSDTATSLCLSILLALCGLAGANSTSDESNIFRSALVDQMPAISGKLVLVLQVSNDASAKSKAAALLRVGAF